MNKMTIPSTIVALLLLKHSISLRCLRKSPSPDSNRVRTTAASANPASKDQGIDSRGVVYLLYMLVKVSCLRVKTAEKRDKTYLAV